MLISEVLKNVEHLISSGFNDKAITLLSDNFEQQSENPQLHFQLIHLLQQQADFENSEKVLVDAEKKFGNLLQLVLLRSTQSKGIGDHNLAIKYLYQYLERNQENPLVWATLGQLLEQMNRLKELGELLNKVPEKFQNRPLIALVKAKLLRRKSKLKESLHSLDSIESLPNIPWISASIKFEYSKVFDKLGNFDKSWESAVDANNLTTLVWPKRWQKSNQIRLMLAQSINQLPKLQQSDEKQKAPCFLIGFPRSGTTLLDRILDSHSNITVLNEEPIIEKIANQLGGFEYYSKLDQLTQADIAYCREHYILQFKKIHPNVSENDVLVDKLPLNILYLPLINKIFPESKIILSIRHPLDSCISCFFQEFIATPALSNFLNFEQSINFYHQVFSSSEMLIEKNPNVINIRYEDILSEFESTLTTLLEHLGLEWQTELENFHRHDINQPINTPSYHQVVMPIYKDSVNRWEKYQSRLGDANKKLKHWIDKFGYGDV